MGRSKLSYTRGAIVCSLIAATVVVITTANTAAAPAAGTIELVSVSHLGGLADNHSTAPAISADGNVVAFRSQATDLLDPSGPAGIYVRDLAAGTTTLAIADPTPATTGDIIDLDLSGDGRFLAFTSKLDTLVEGDTNGQPDAFVLDRTTGITALVSVLPNGDHLEAGAQSAGITADGSRVAFTSYGNNCATRRAFVRDLGPAPQSVLVDTCVASAKLADGGTAMVLRRLAVTPSTQQLSELRQLAPGGGTSPLPGTYAYAVSADGATVLLGDAHETPVRLTAYHVPSGTSELVDVNDAGDRFTSGFAGPGLSADGRFVVFAGRAISPQLEDVTAVWLRDRWAGTTTRVSPTWVGNPPCGGSPTQCLAYVGDSGAPVVNADGTVVAFQDFRPLGGPRFFDILAAGHQPADVSPPPTGPTTTAPPTPPTTATDTTPPNATVTTPQPNQVVSASPIVFSGNATDDRGVTFVRIGIRNTATQQWWGADGWQAAYSSWNADLSNVGGTTTTWSSSWTPPGPGTYALQPAAVDDARNPDPTKPWVRFSYAPTVVDTEAPNAEVTAPKPGDTLEGSSVQFSGTATDNIGVAAVLLAIRNTSTFQWWNGTAWQPAFTTTDATLANPGGQATGWTSPWSPPGAGSYALQVAAVDAAGNVDPTKPWVPFSTSPVAAVAPDGRVFTPSRGDTLSGGSPLQLQGDAQDDDGVAAVRVAIRDNATLQWWNGTGWQTTFTTTDATLADAGAQATGWTYQWAPPAPGDYALQIAAVDVTDLVDPTKPWVPFSYAP